MLPAHHQRPTAPRYLYKRHTWTSRCRPSAQEASALQRHGVDRDPLVIRNWQHLFPLHASYVEGDAVEFLASQRLAGDEVVYCDPPYLPSTRRRTRVHRHDYGESDHIRLLETLLKLPCRVAISGYPSELYDGKLCRIGIGSQKAHGLRQKARIGQAKRLWFRTGTNARPAFWRMAEDPRHLGGNFRERQEIKRRQQRLQRRISTLSPQEQRLLSEWLDDHMREEDGDAGLLLLEG